VVVFALAIAVGACADPPPTATPDAVAPLPRFPLTGPAAGVEQAILMEQLVPRWDPGPDGREVVDDFGQNTQPLEAGRTVVVLSDPIAFPDGEWVRVYVPIDVTRTPGDFYAWLPRTLDGRPTLRAVASAACPREATIKGLARLLQPDRLRCAGDGEITMDVRTWLPVWYSSYEVDPSWYATTDRRRSVAIFDPGSDPFGRDAPETPERAGFWIDARVPPEVGEVPLGMIVRVTGRFGDPTANGCTRRREPAMAALGPPGAGLPDEAKADSIEWCREQFVVGDWDVLLGPEGRPIELAAPQLLRSAWLDPQPGVPVACGGVGMPMLTMRIDPTRVDPVWIETPDGARSLARFGHGFTLQLEPGPVIVATNGVTLVDREIVDPDRGKPGLMVCPEGYVVEFGVDPGQGG